MKLMPRKRHELEANGAARLPLVPLRMEMDRLFDRFFEDFWNGNAPTEPSGVLLEVDETDEEVLVRAEVPGIEPTDLDIQLRGEVLTLSGEKKEETESANGSSHYSGRRFGAFHRTIQLPCMVDPDKVKAQHKNGVVTISLRKSEAIRPKRITVKTA